MNVIIRKLSQQQYENCWRAMQQFTATRTEITSDEIWLLQHPPVFTQGQNGKAEHILNPGTIPIIPVDRGGQVTYHGPGQSVVYTLIDLKRKKMTIRDLVTALENTIIAFLSEYQIEGHAKREAPGVYVANKKICSLGLRVRRGCSYHGLAFNIDMDLEPFSRINPCGFSKLTMTQLKDFNVPLSIAEVETKLIDHLLKHLGYTTPHFVTELNYGPLS